MKKEKLISALVLVVAVVVIVESIILVSNLNKNSADIAVSSSEVDGLTPTKVVREPVGDFVFETDSKEMKVGKSYKVSLSFVGKENISLDAMELYLKYDPTKLTVSKYTVASELPKDDKVSGVNAKTGLISSVFLWGIGESYSVKSGEVNSLLSFVVTPKVEGDTSISLVTGSSDEKSVTLIVESLTSSSLPFLGNTLEINATK